MPRLVRGFVAILVWIGVASSNASELWLYVAENLQVEARVDRLETLLRRAASAGYTHVLLADSKMARLGDVPDFYFRHVERVKAAAKRHGLELVPAVFPVGYSNDILWHDPDLAEGPPVRNVRLAVRGGQAVVESEAPPTLRGGDFSDLGAWDWKDPTVRAEEGAAVIRDPRGANARIVQRLRLLPWRQYHLALRIRTREFRGQPEVKVLAGEGGRVLNFDSLGTQPTQDWRVHHVVFHSLEHTNAAVYLGAWGADSGELWMDDATLQETALVNLVRRPGAPLVLRTEGGRVLREGEDFEAVRDPRMGRVKWPGDYDVYHEPPVIRMRGSWQEGSPLRLDCQHAVSIHDGQVMLDPSEPRVLELLGDQARRVHGSFGVTNYFMSHDEIRVLGWSDSFRRSGMTPGQCISANARACVGLIRAVAPGARVLVWSDMFDPHHNAVRGPYYLVNGDLRGSWEGLDASVVVMNWNHGKRDESLRFFAERGHRQVVAAYYDNPLRELDDWLRSVRNVQGVLGFMYTTWRGNYADLEAFAARVRAAGNANPTPDASRAAAWTEPASRRAEGADGGPFSARRDSARARGICGRAGGWLRDRRRPVPCVRPIARCARASRPACRAGSRWWSSGWPRCR